MITIRRSEERGHADHGWLDSRHTFSFADYRDPDFMGFSVLRVVNQDRVQPGRGFGTHGHQDMEIVSYVLDGVLAHKDNMGNGAEMRPGEVQLMSAGTGVTHSEFNASATEALHFLQMWILPKERGTKPRYEQREFSAAERRGRLRLVVSPDGQDGSVTIGQDARLYAGLFDGGAPVHLTLPERRAAWVHVARGEVTINGKALQAGDGAAVRDERELAFADGQGAEVVVWDLPAE